jgi:hypothetical protein
LRVSYRALSLALGICLTTVAVEVGADTIAACRERIAQIPGELPVENSEFPANSIPEASTLALDCPELADSLAEHQLAPLLARAEGERRIADLEGLLGIDEFYTRALPVERTTSSALEEALASLGVEPPPPVSIWGQILNWLAQKWRGSGLQLPGWFDDISISEDAIKWTLFAAVALVIIAALAIVANELRHGLKARRKPDADTWMVSGTAAQRDLSFGDLAGARLVEQPGLLLRIVLARLVKAGKINYRASMTHRDIVAVAAQMDSGAGLATISTAAERCAFASWRPLRQDMDMLMQSGRSLLEELDGKHR